jgi:hypothetical protein
MELAVIIHVSVQVTESNWEHQTRVLKVTESNTIGDITRWYRKYIPEGPVECCVCEMESKNPNT